MKAAPVLVLKQTTSTDPGISSSSKISDKRPEGLVQKKLLDIARNSSLIIQPKWITEESVAKATQRWDAPMDGVIWYANDEGLMWYRIVGPGKEDYSALEGQMKTWEQWHALRQEAHPEEYPSQISSADQLIFQILSDYHSQGASEKNKRAERLTKLIGEASTSALQEICTQATQETGFLKLLGPAAQKAQKRLGSAGPKIKLNAISDWLGGTEAPETAVLPCIQMDHDGTVFAGTKTHIIWSGGAAGCIIIAGVSGKKAYMTHATPLSWRNDTAATVALLKKSAGSDAAIYLASQMMGTGQEQPLLAELAKQQVVVSRIFTSSSLAIDANTGQVRADIDPAGLPK